MATAEHWTIGRLLTWTTEYFQKRGTGSPRLDAEVLLAHARGCQRIELYTAFGEDADETLRAKYRELVKRRAAGTPVAYLVGRREFYSLPFYVTADVLIPRPETEFVVIAVLDRIRQRFGRDKVQEDATGAQLGTGVVEAPATPEPTEAAAEVDVLDIGTGSGIIAISIARHALSARVLAVDASPAALAIARRNASELGVEQRVELSESDLLGNVPANRTFDFIVSNPPYISEPEFAALAPEVKDHEPRLALVGGPTGTEIIERLIPQAAERLKPGGWLILEISPMIQQRVEALIAADGRFQPATTTKDLAGLPRVVQAQRRSL